VKLWHDDIRPPKEEGWVWARTNERAMELLETGEVEEISMDHDLGLHTISMPEQYHELTPDQQHAIFCAGRSEDTGLDLVLWMIANDKVPPIVTIHSWNAAGAMRMMMALADAANAEVLSRSLDLTVKPFEVPK
jgi:hypothetical protein